MAQSASKPKRSPFVSCYDPTRVKGMRLQDANEWPWPECGISIGGAFDLYSKEHSHRRKEWVYNITEALTQFLSVNALDESWPVAVLSKDRFKVYKTALLNGTATPPNKRKPGPITIQRKLGILHHFVKWLVANDYLPADTMAGVALPTKMVSNARVHKDGFSDEQLGTIFNALSSYRHHPDPMRVQWWWVCMLLAHSGCRVSEILFLRRADLVQVEGIWCVNVTEEGRLLKNKMSKRLVPVHSAVLKAGLLDYAHSQPEDGRLFPDLSKYMATKPSQWFTKLLKQTKLKTPSLTLHSLRHTVAVKLERARVHYSLMRRLLGHAIGKSVEDRVYLGSLTYSPAELKEAIEVLSLPPIS